MELVRRRGPAESLPALLDRPFFNDFDQLFDSLMPMPIPWFLLDSRQAQRLTPAVDVLEQDGQLVVHADLPGVDPDSLKVEAENGYLKISAQRSSQNEERRGGYVRLERSFGSFQRTLQLPDGVDPTEINASYRDGVLEIRMPSARAAVQTATRIPIEGVQASQVLEGEATETAAEADSVAVESAGS